MIEPVKVKKYGKRIREFAARKPEMDARINVLSGSVRSGKTWGVIPKILTLCRYPVEGHKVITGVSKQAIQQNVLEDLFEISGEENYTYNRQSGELVLFDSKWLVIGARDEGSEKSIRGMTIGAVVSDELSLMPRSFFQMLLSRMSPRGARLYATTNPDSPYHWVKMEVLDNDRLERGLGKDLWWENFTLEDNPNLSPEYKEFVKRSYTGVFYKRFILGEWVMAEGAIYRDVLDGVFYDNDDKPMGLTSPGTAERWVAVDYGTSNAQVYGDFYDDGNTVWLEHEYYWDGRKEGRQKTDSQYADDLIKGFVEWPGLGSEPRVWPGVIIDPSAASFRAELVSRGVFVVDANNEVEDGIRRVATMFGHRKLRVHERCVNTRKDLETYSWDTKKTDKGKDQPLKVHDHSCDMIRYYVRTRIPDFRLGMAA